MFTLKSKKFTFKERSQGKDHVMFGPQFITFPHSDLIEKALQPKANGCYKFELIVTTNKKSITKEKIFCLKNGKLENDKY